MSNNPTFPPDAEPTIEQLSAMLKSEDVEIRLSAVTHLYKLNNEAVIQPLAEALKDNFWKVRIIARHGLIKRRNPISIPLLISMLNTDSPSTKTAVSYVLLKLDELSVLPLIEAYETKSPKIRTRVFEILKILYYQQPDSLIGIRLIELMLPGLKDENTNIRWTTARDLYVFKDDRLVEPLIGLLNDNDSSVVLHATRTLSRYSDKRALTPLLNILKDKSQGVGTRTYAAIGLSNIKDSAATEPLITILTDATERLRLREKMALSLRDLGDKSAVPVLLDIAFHKESDNRYSAVLALGKFQDITVFEPLLSLLEDENIKVCAAAASALGDLGDKSAIEPLKKTLTTNNYNVVYSAIKALWQLGGDSIIPEL